LFSQRSRYQKACLECGNLRGGKKKIKQASLQLLCQLVKKINPLHDGQKKINPFPNGQDTSKALVDPSGVVFIW